MCVNYVFLSRPALCHVGTASMAVSKMHVTTEEAVTFPWFCYDVVCLLGCVVSSAGMTVERSTWKGLGGSGDGPVEVLSGNLPGGSEIKHEKSHLG